ncbi:MAG: hypothetical protein J2P57_21800, partial [Acidimicrobiaceae bacterium]|nr:hypothetical protein [Acidimicrobiaceae bacterium]
VQHREEHVHQPADDQDGPQHVPQDAHVPATYPVAPSRSVLLDQLAWLIDDSGERTGPVGPVRRPAEWS